MRSPTFILTGFHDDQVAAVAWSSNSELLASGSWDDTVRIWNTVTGEYAHTLFGHLARVLCVAWSRCRFLCDKILIASGSADGTVRLWSDRAGNWRQSYEVLTGHTRAVTCVAWMIDPTRLASGSDDHTVMLWDVVTRGRLQVFAGLHSIAAIGTTATYSRVSAPMWMCRDGSLCVWEEEMAQSRIITRVEDGATCAALQAPVSGNPTRVVIACQEGGRCLDIRSEKSVTLGISTRMLSCVALSCDGKQVAMGQYDGVVLICDAATGKVRKRIERSESRFEFRPSICSIAWSPDGTRIATASDRKIYIWTVCNWSDKRNRLFGPETRRSVFCLMCVRKRLQSMPTTTNNNLPDLPMELWLEVFAALAHTVCG